MQELLKPPNTKILCKAAASLIPRHGTGEHDPNLGYKMMTALSLSSHESQNPKMQVLNTSPVGTQMLQPFVHPFMTLSCTTGLERMDARGCFKLSTECRKTEVTSFTLKLSSLTLHFGLKSSNTEDSVNE